MLLGKIIYARLQKRNFSSISKTIYARLQKRKFSASVLLDILWVSAVRKDIEEEKHSPHNSIHRGFVI